MRRCRYRRGADPRCRRGQLARASAFARESITQPDAEIERFEAARSRAARELDSVRHLLTQRGRAQDAGIFTAQATMIGDPKLIGRMEEEIRVNLQSAEAAVARVAIEFHNALKASEVPLGPRQGGRRDGRGPAAGPLPG